MNVEHLFIPTSMETAATEISAFSAGGAACVKVGTTVAIAPGSLASTDKFQIVWKKSDGTIKTSPILSLAWAKSKVTVGYTAGTAMVKNITPTLPSSQAYGDRYAIKIIDTTPGTMNLPSKTFEVVHKGTDYTVATLIDAFVALIGTDTDLKVVATDSTTTLTITGTTKWNHFAIALDGNLKGDTVTNTTALVPMAGTTAQMRELEAKLMAESEGITNQVNLRQYYVPDSEVEASVNYEQYKSTYEVPVDTKDAMKSKGVETYTINIAEDTSETAATAHLGYALNAEI